MTKRILLFFLAVLMVVMAWQYKLISYGLDQGIGQLTIIFKAKPISETLNDPNFPDSLKKKLLLIQDIKKFAVDSLGIKPSENYTTLFNQHGKPILWVLTASEKYALKAKEWYFPFLGNVSYKGFFNYEKGLKEKAILDTEGLDTDYDVVSGWSTLGWCKDPVLSGMLIKKEGNLANLIIHELTHGTLYIRDNVEFNENLASFVGDKGAEKFLAITYGITSEQYCNYEEGKFDMALYSNHILNGAKRLDSLYKTFNAKTKPELKETLKQHYIKQIMEAGNLLPFYKKSRFSKLFNKEKMPNNSFFIDYKRYRSRQNIFEHEFQHKFHADLKKYLTYLKLKYSGA